MFMTYFKVTETCWEDRKWTPSFWRAKYYENIGELIELYSTENVGKIGISAGLKLSQNHRRMFFLMILKYRNLYILV